MSQSLFVTLLVAVIVASSLLEGCVIGAAVIGAHVYSTHETKKALKQSVTRYDEAASLVQVGDSKDAVLALLEPTQHHLKAKLRRQPHSYQHGETLVEIYYFRSEWHADGLSTDDEFTPYIFRNGTLSHIGWRTLTGARTQSRAR